eukprot:246651_1
MSIQNYYHIALIAVSLVASLISLIITIRVTQGWFAFFKQYSNIIKKQVYMILFSFIIYPVSVTLYCSIGWIDLLLSQPSYIGGISTMLWLLVQSSFFVFRIIRLVQSDRDLHTKLKRNTKLKHNRKKYIKQSLIYFLDAIWIVFYLISHRIVLVKKDQSQQHSTVIVIPNLLRFSVTHS